MHPPPFITGSWHYFDCIFFFTSHSVTPSQPLQRHASSTTSSSSSTNRCASVNFGPESFRSPSLPNLGTTLCVCKHFACRRLVSRLGTCRYTRAPLCHSPPSSTSSSPPQHTHGIASHSGAAVTEICSSSHRSHDEFKRNILTEDA